MLDLLRQLKENNIYLYLNENDIKVKFNGEKLPTYFLEQIKANKQSLIQYLTKLQEQRGNEELIAILPSLENYVVSSSQRRLWILSQLGEGNAAYNMPGVYIFDGELNITALEKAFNMIITRHEILRTYFKEDESGDLRQWVMSANRPAFKLPCRDLRAADDIAQHTKLFVQQDFSQPFDLAKGPLLRAGLYQTGNHTWVFSYVMHHIISDGWSMGILIKELMQYYNALSTGIDFLQAPLRIQYKDYAAWQQAELGTASLSRHKTYWLKQFEADIPVLELAGDRIRPAVRGFSGGSVHLHLDKQLTTGLKGMLSGCGATTFMGVLALVKILLYRYTGQNEIVVGSPVAGRENSELDNQIGCYLNLLPLKTNLVETEGFLSVLQATKQVTLAAFEHQVYPYDQLVNELDLARDASRNPLFDTMVILQNAGTAMPRNLSLNGLNVSNYNLEGAELSKLDLTFNFTERNEGLDLHIEYNTDIFNKTTIERIGRHLSQLMQVVINAPLFPIKNLDFLTFEEKDQLIGEFNPVPALYSGDKTIVQLFEEQVLCFPDRIAVVFENKEASYREINEQANRLAAYLKERYRLDKDDRVVISIRRSLEMLVAMLGILKSGAAYVPVDPDYPAERIAYVVKDSNCKIVLDAEELEKFYLQSADYSSENILKAAEGADLAYVIYTSGSTGKPKGVMIEHRNLASFFSGMENLLGHEPGVMLSLTNYTFDISVLELLWSLTTGGQVIIQADVKNISADESHEIKPLDFGLFYAGDSSTPHKDNYYQFLLAGAKHADSNGYQAIWTPQRYFHKFGGHYPSPAVLGAALSANTKNINIRAGGVVLPLDNPVFFAEEWSVIDNLSNGRAGVSFASELQFNPPNFDLENYSKQQESFYDGIETIQKLWKRQITSLSDGNDQPDDTQIFPRPVQNDLPIWITLAGSTDAFISAGKRGLNILTHLLGESIDGLSDKITAYRNAYLESGHRGEARVVLMLHTFVGDDLESTYRIAKVPLIKHIKSSKNLVENLALNKGYDLVSDPISEENIDTMLDSFFDTCVSTSSLIGTKTSCKSVLENVAKIGVDEIACLVDFGIEEDLILKNLGHLTDLKESHNHHHYSLSSQIKKYKVNQVQCTPSTAALINSHISDWSSMQSIKTWLIGGERISPSLVHHFHDRMPKLKLYNVYGPTETTVWSSSLEMKRGDFFSIGKPLKYERFFITDFSNSCLQPIGVVGELCIGGNGLARGYLNQPGLTAEKFIVNPFLSGELMYKTGDLARWLIDGNVEFIGRRDDQVKVRGHRIELGEIENALMQHPAITATAVIIHADAEQENELHCYFVSPQGPETVEMREFLAKMLPSFMVPGHYVRLEKMPLTPNGKIDRKQLPKLGSEVVTINTGIDYVAAGNSVESKLIAIWENVLGKKRIGTRDDFFKIGGHSLKATSLASHIHRTFNVRLGLKDLFNTPILIDQAKLIAKTARFSFHSIEATGQNSTYALSSSQRRLWLLSQFPEGNNVYNMPGAYVFDGNLNVLILKKAFTALIKRHEALRTIFEENPETGVMQVVLPDIEDRFSLEYNDFRLEGEREERIKSRVSTDYTKAFDLAKGPLLRAALYQVEDYRWVFSYVMHHIISDGWSMGILIKELLQYYNGMVSGTPFSPPPLRIQYKDYAAWQQEQLSDEALNGHRTYWLKQFEGKLPILSISGDHHRPAVKTYRATSLGFLLSLKLTKGIKDLVSGQGATLFMGLITAVKILLYRYSGQDDIIIGSPIAGRGHADLENQIGYYVNTLALRTRFDGSNSFYALLENVKAVTIAAYEHQEYPFDKLVDELNLRRDMSRNPLFDVMVVLHNLRSNHPSDLEFKDLKVKTFDGINHDSGKFDLTFDFTEIGDELHVNLEYNTDIFDNQRIEQFKNNLEQLIDAIIEQPERPIATIDFLSSREKHQLLKEFNPVTQSHSSEKDIISLFEAQARTAFERIAVVCNEKEWSYHQINERANRLAAYLKEQKDIERGDRVGIMLERSAELIVTILAVLKSGAAYIPIDPEYPKDRISFMVADSSCKLLIDWREFDNFIDQETKYSALNLLQTDLAGADFATDLAYIIYTSGSTGKPKGVMISRSSLQDYVSTFTDIVGLELKDRVVFQSSISFDTHIEEIFPILLKGGCLIIAPQGGRDILELHKLIQTTRVTLLSATPLVLNEINKLEFLNNLRVIVSGGDRFNNAYLSNYIGQIKVYNSYGPAEATVCSTFYEITDHLTVPSIGKPIANRKIFILNDYGQLQPVGVEGEIHIGGQGLAIGYLNQPELTDEKFKSHTVVSERRLYKTGDCARWLNTGNIEFMGRKDDQVKVRGYRIELGEIEYNLQQYPDVEAAVVVSKLVGTADYELISFIISKTEINSALIRTYLSDFLPFYMIPSHFVQLPALPMTPNDKIDINYLLNLDRPGDNTEYVLVAPRNEAEEKLFKIWRKILGTGEISIHSNFFSLGGNSFKIIELQRAVNLEFKADFGIAKFFELLTIEDLAAALSQEHPASKGGQDEKIIDFINF